MGASAGVVGALLRWEKGEEELKSSALPFKVIWKESRALISIAFVAGFSYFNYYLITTFMNGFLPLVSSITKKEAMELNTGLLIVDMAALPLFGYLAKKVPKEKMMLGAILAILIGSIPLFQMLEGATLGTAAFVRLTLTIFGVALAAPFHAWAFERAPAEHRFLICAVGTAIGSRLLGSPAPAVGLWLYEWTGWAPAAAAPLWILGLCAAGWLAIGRKRLSTIHEKNLTQSFRDAP
jgi:MHS family proline/betaine transporter-like MFS transporter